MSEQYIAAITDGKCRVLRWAGDHYREYAELQNTASAIATAASLNASEVPA